MANGSDRLQKSVKDEPAQFWDIWAAHEAELRRLCAHFCRGRHDEIEDLLATARIHAWDRWGTYSLTVRNPGPWLAQLTRNVCLNDLRSKKRWFERLPYMAQDMTERATDPTVAAEHHIMLEWAMRTLDALPTRLREPFRAHVLHHHSYSDIARAYGITESVARQRVAAARRLLAQMINEEDSPRRDGSPPDVPDVPGEPPGSHGAGDDPGLEAFGALLEEIAARMVDTRVIHVPLPSGGVLEYHAVFEHGVSRCEQRIKTLLEYVARHPRGWRRRLELANLLIAQSRVAEAASQLRIVLERQPRALQASLRLGQLLVLLGKPDEAAGVYAAALAHVQHTATRHHLNGLMERALSGGPIGQYASAQRSERYERAVAEFRAAIAEEPQNLAHHHELAATYDAWGKRVEALAAYDEALRIDPDDVYALARCNNAATALGCCDLAIERLERAVAIDPHYTYAVKLLADHRASRGLVRGAEGRRTRELAKSVLARDPESADAWDALSRYYDYRNELDKSVSIWRAFVSRNPGNAKAWTFLGTALFRLGEPVEAARAYVKSQQLDPGWLDVYWRGTPVLIQVGRTNEALRWVEELRARFPDHWDACRCAGEFLYELGGDPETCLRLVRRGVELQPDVPAAWHAYARLLARVGRYDEALAAFERVVETADAPDTLPAAYVPLERGRVLRAVGREEEAVASFREFERHARSRRGLDPFYLRNVGLALAELGDLKGAERAYRSAVKAGAWYARDEYEEVQRRLAASSGGG